MLESSKIPNIFLVYPMSQFYLSNNKMIQDLGERKVQNKKKNCISQR